MTITSVLDFIPSGEHAAIVARTSTYDATNDIQDWLDFCKTNKVKGFLDAGRYRITGPVFLTEDATETCHIEGEGFGSAGQHTKSEIEATQLTTPALCIQNARAVRIANIAITGANVAPDSVSPPSKDQSDYITAGVRTSRYSPQCAICIDPAVGNTPPDGGYPGIPYQGSTGGSAGIVLENVSIRNFAVGLMISPDGESSQGDNIHLSHCDIHFCDILISIGQTQNRSIEVNQSDFGHCRICFSGRDHGLQQGVPLRVDSSQIIRSYYIFRFASDKGSMSLSNVYAENMLSLGQWGIGFASTRYPLFLNGCEFNLSSTDADNSASILLEVHGPLLASCCFFGDRTSITRVMNFVGASSFIRFDTCVFLGIWDVEFAPIAQGRAITGSRFLNSEVIADGVSPFFLNNLITNVSLKQVRNISNVQSTSTQISFNTTDAGSRVKVGTIIFWKILPQLNGISSYDIPSLVVISITSNNVVCDMLFDADEYDTESTSAFVTDNLYEDDVKESVEIGT